MNQGTKPGEIILDLSSAKLVSLFLADKVRCHVTAVDAWDREVDSWKILLRCVDPEMKSYKLLKLGVADGENLPYPDSHFDKIYSISVIEHITPERDGDIRAMHELARVLKPGGRLVITVPYSKKYYASYIDCGEYKYGGKKEGAEKILWARYYDEVQLKERLLNLRA